MKKIIKITLLVVLLFLVFLVSIPFLFKGRILGLVKQTINENVNARVEFTDFDITIFRSFPNLTLQLSNLSVVGLNAFEGDTLAAIEKTAVTVDLMSAIRGSEMNIREVLLDHAALNFLVLKDGKANWDIAKSSGESTQPAESGTFKASLKHYELRRSRLVYDDASLGFYLSLDSLNHEGKGDFTSDLFTLITKTTVASMNMSYGGIAYFVNIGTSIDADLEMDMKQSKYSFKQNTIRLNELSFGLDGYIAMPGDDINMDLKFDASRNEFRNFMSLIPGVYKEGFNQVQSSGNLSFTGFVKGTYNELSMPGFGLTLAVDNGNFKYPDLPVGINNVAMDLTIANPDGVPDHTAIDMNKLHVELGKEPFDARLMVRTPVSDASIDGGVSGRIDLANISKIIPLDEGTSLAGVINANLAAKGRLSSIENRQYEQFQASGTLLLNGFRYASRDLHEPVSIDIAELIFNPKNVTLNRLSMQAGKTRLNASGWLDNLLSYTFRENELLKGTLDVRADVIDLNEWMSDSDTAATTSADTTSGSVLEIPANIDFLMTLAAGKVLYENMTLDNVKGNIAIRDQTLGLNELSFGMLEGKIVMNGLYESRNPKKPSFYYDLDASKINIRQAFNTFESVQKMAPIAEKCSGTCSANFDVRGTMDATMSPDLNSLTGGGKLSTSGVTIDNFAPLVKTADALKMDQFKKVSVSDANLSFKFENGRVHVAPFDVTLSGIKANVQGSNGFDQTIDYTMAMNIPMALAGPQATGVMNGLVADLNRKAGTHVNLGNEVKVNVKVTGTVTDPKIETGLKEAAASTVSNAQEQIKQVLEDKKKEIEDAAKSEVDRMKKEAEEKAKAEAERAKKEAEEKAKAESEKMKKEAEEKLKKEADDKLKNLFGKPKK